MKKVIMICAAVIVASHFATDFFKASDAGIKRFLIASISTR
jgi:hypothetical protein